MDTSGSQNFSIEVTLTGQLFTWRRHTDQLKKCFEEAELQLADTSAVSEEEEDTSGITKVWLDPNLSPGHPSSDVNRQLVDSNNLPRRNPPRNRKPPDRLTY